MADGVVKMPIYVRIGGKEIELGTLEMDLKATASGRIVTPSTSQI